jgi:hypothetical protein
MPTREHKKADTSIRWDQFQLTKEKIVSDLWNFFDKFDFDTGDEKIEDRLLG